MTNVTQRPTDGDLSSTLKLVVHQLEEMSKKFDKMEAKLEAQYARREEFMLRHDAFDQKLGDMKKDFKAEIEAIHADQRWVIRGVLAAGGTFLVGIIMAAIKSGMLK